MTINFKKLSDKATTPIRTDKSGAGFNLTAVGVSTEVNERGQIIVVFHTGLAVEIPEGYEATLRPLPTIAAKTIRMCDAPSLVKGGLNEEVVGRFVVTTDVVPAVYKDDEPFAQIVFNKIEDIELIELVDSKDELSAASGSQSPSEDKDESINSETATEPAAGDQSAPEQAK